jgi:CRP/FNR family cyclic AMP-dependent transcriptional regulator
MFDAQGPKAALFISSLSEADREKLAGFMEPWEALNGGIVMQQGQEVSTLWMIDVGEIRFQIGAASGRAVITSIAIAGHCFGDVELMDGGPAISQAIAATDCKGWRMSKMQVFQALEAVPAFAQLMLAELSRGVRLMHQLYMHTLLLPLEHRLALVLLNLSQVEVEKGVRRIVVSLTQDQLSQFTGASRQIVSRHLSYWGQKDWIATRYRKIELLDVDGLKSIFNEDLHPIMLALLEYR